jgi:hypothetical protein
LGKNTICSVTLDKQYSPRYHTYHFYLETCLRIGFWQSLQMTTITESSSKRNGGGCASNDHGSNSGNGDGDGNSDRNGNGDRDGDGDGNGNSNGNSNGNCNVNSSSDDNNENSGDGKGEGSSGWAVLPAPCAGELHSPGKGKLDKSAKLEGQMMAPDPPPPSLKGVKKKSMSKGSVKGGQWLAREHR